MTHKTRRTKIFTLALGLVMCLAVSLGIVSVNPQSVRAETTTIDTLEVAFRKVNVGDSLAAAFEFEDETAKTLKVPVGANYTATLLFVSKNGQARTLWEKDKASLPWSNVENQPVEQKVAYYTCPHICPHTKIRLTSHLSCQGTIKIKRKSEYKSKRKNQKNESVKRLRCIRDVP